MQGNGAVSLFEFPTDDNVRKQWIDFVKRSYCEEFKITTITVFAVSTLPPIVTATVTIV